MDRQVDERISRWLEADAPRQMPDRVFQATFERTRRSSQHKGWRGLLDGSGATRHRFQLASGFVVVLLVVVAVGFSVERRQSALDPGQSSQPAASPTVPVSPSVAPYVDHGIFAPIAGRIVYADAPVIRGIDPTSLTGPTTIEPAVGDGPLGTPLAWSSDSTALLLKNADNLFVLHADGSKTRVAQRLSGFGGGTISPDGSRVVYADHSDEVDGLPNGKSANGALFAVAAGGGPTDKLWEGPVGIVGSPTFSPDGTEIAVVDGNGDTRNSIWIVNADGSDPHTIVSGMSGVGGLAWSPAGDRLALVFQGAIYTIATDGSDLKRIAGGDGDSVDMTSWAAAPFWSWDGSKIAYTTGCIEGPGSVDTTGCILTIANADGSDVRTMRYGLSGPWNPIHRDQPSP